MRPNNTTYVGVAISLGRSARPLECLDLLRSMHEKGTPPDAICYLAVLKVLDRWDLAEEASLLFEEMVETREQIALMPGACVRALRACVRASIALSRGCRSYFVSGGGAC